MFVVDLNQVLFSTFFMSVKSHTNIEIEAPLIRYMALNTLRSINVKFRKKYGEMVIASDSMRNWRREVFVHYKAARRSDRKKSDLDWKSIFSCMDDIKSDLKEYFPYKFIHVDRAEADDIIGVLASKFGSDPLLIVSGDKDFRQLHYNNVSQYDPVGKKMITEPDPAGYLHEHIIRGDRGDGIPNALSPDDTFVTQARQKPVTKKSLLLFEDPTNIKDPQFNKYYYRNKMLIDLSQTPVDLVNEINKAFEERPAVDDRSMILPYFRLHRIKNLVEHVNDF